MDKNLMGIWGSVLDILSRELNEASYNTWMKNIVPIKIEDYHLYLRIPNAFSRNILENVYKQNIIYALETITGESCQVTLLDPLMEEDDPEDEEDEQHTLPVKNRPYQGHELKKKSTLVPRYTFDNFVVGKSNQLAFAASQAVSKNPSEEYNPLFIYGGVGLGKTHLMHAIGHYIEEHDPDANVMYVTFEQFLNGFINSIQRKDSEIFRDIYRNVDVLMVDDIQFISGKEGTQEEFFHTFNSLYFSNKQIIISSDRPPGEIKTLEERLRSRFESGLIVDIQAPDLETRIAILRNKAKMESIDVPDDVLNYIGTHVKSNIRELEGSLITVKAYATLIKQEITLDLAQQALDNLLVEANKTINVENIIKYICQKYRLKQEDLLSKKRTRAIAFPRQIAMYLTRELTDLSLPKIGQEFGGRDHTTVLHAYEKISKLIDDEDDFKKEIQQYINELQS